MTTVQITKRRSTDFTETEIKQALTVLAFCSGNTRRAHRELLDKGLRAPADQRTLWTWSREHYAVEYQRICDEELPKVYAQLAERNEDLALQHADAEEKLLDQLMANRQDLEPRDVANAIRNVATSKAIAVDKASVIRGRPTEITEHRSLSDVVRAMERYAGIVNVQGQAIDVEASEVQHDIAAGPEPSDVSPSQATHSHPERARTSPSQEPTPQ